ncbi:MAG: acyl-CoA dehydrogenase family protein [Thermomicrobiales bacterium]
MTTIPARTILTDVMDDRPDEFALLARDFVRREFPPYLEAAQRDAHQYPHELMKKCAEVGLLGLEIPERYDGNVVPSIQQVAVMEELARGDAGLGLNILVQNSLTAFPITKFGTEAQRARYLPRMARGEIIACFGLTEPNTGSDAKAIRCKATWDAARRGWIVNGAKRFITAASASRVIVLAARTGRPEDRGHGISVLLAEIGPGVGGVEASDFNKLGQPGSQLCEVVFQNHFVPEDALMGTRNEGWQIIEATLQHSRIWVAAQGSGIARHALDEAEKYTQEREQFGKKLAAIPDVQNHLQIMRRQVEIARLLVRKAAAHEQAGDEYSFVWASLAKLVAGETALWAAAEAMLLHGGMGYTKEMPISQIFADAAVIRIYEGAAHIQAKIIGKHLPGKDILALLPPSGAFLRDARAFPSPADVMAAIEAWEIV